MNTLTALFIHMFPVGKKKIFAKFAKKISKLCENGSWQEGDEPNDRMEKTNASILSKLQREILPLQGYKPALHNTGLDFELGPIWLVFPHAVFPLGAVHEFLCESEEGTAATTGFVAALAAMLMRNSGVALWIGAYQSVYPPALKAFGLPAERIIFVELPRENDILWAVEEALKCGSVATVIGEVSALSFTASRRLQLAVEKSKVTGFLLFHQRKNSGTTASLTRWRITPLKTELTDDLPGVGFPRWQVELLRVRNGKPGRWSVEWIEDGFRFGQRMAVVIGDRQKKAG